MRRFSTSGAATYHLRVKPRIGRCWRTVALLTFPVAPSNGTIYPSAPPAGTNIYQWVTAEQTWRLLGTSTGVTAGIYGNSLAVPQITIDATGRITFAQNVAIQLGDTTQVGLVQLVDDTTSNDATKALTAAQGYYLQNQIGNLSSLIPPASNLVAAINAAGSPSGATAGTYGTNRAVGQFTVTSQGRITSASNVPIALASTVGTGLVQVGANLNITGAGLLSVSTASTTTLGVTQLVNDTTTNDSTKALTAAAGYNLQQQIDALSVANNLTFAGTINGANGLMLQVTSEGTAQGFAVGSTLPVATLTNKGYFVVVKGSGTFTPPGSPIVTVNTGDWLISTGSIWTVYSVGVAPRLTFVDNIAGSFNGVRTNFTLRVGGVNITPGNNLLVFIGGIPQIPGVSYTVTGFTITFIGEPPPFGATFIGVTVV